MSQNNDFAYLRTGTSRVSSFGKMMPEDIEPHSAMGQIYLVDCPYVVTGPELRSSSGMPQGELNTNTHEDIQQLESLYFIKRWIIAYGQKLILTFKCYLTTYKAVENPQAIYS